MLGIVALTFITPVLLSFNSQGFLDSILKDVGSITEKTIGKLETTVSESVTTYSDNNYQTKTTNFSSGQIVYLQVKTNIDGTTKKTVDLLDSSKGKILSFELNKSSSNPFIYTQSFVAPSIEGIYYLDIEIRSGESSVYKAQQNINVGKTEGSVKTESSVTATANTGGNVQNNSISEVTPQSTPQMIPKIAGDSGKSIASIPARMNEFFSLLNKLITNVKQLLGMLKP